MRLIVCIVVLIVSVLDARFGKSGTAIEIAGFVTGGLLALSMVIDFVFPEHPKSDDATHEAHQEAGD
jgi:hypothetical protein